MGNAESRKKEGRTLHEFVQPVLIRDCGIAGIRTPEKSVLDVMEELVGNQLQLSEPLRVAPPGPEGVVVERRDAAQP